MGTHHSFRLIVINQLFRLHNPAVQHFDRVARDCAKPPVVSSIQRIIVDLWRICEESGKEKEKEKILFDSAFFPFFFFCVFIMAVRMEAGSFS